MPSNQLIIWKDKTLFMGSNPRAVTQHQHPVIQLVIGIEKPFLSMNSAGEWEEKQGLLIAPNHAHECDAKNIPIFSLDIDPESDLGEWILNHQLNSTLILECPTPQLSPIDHEKIANHLKNEDWKGAEALIEKIFNFEGASIPLKRDHRVKSIVAYIEQNIHQKITTEDLMEVAHLSESRMLHLFKNVMGLPIRNYILWFRVKMVFRLITQGNSLTYAAHEAGFSDQAHLTRTFVKTIGLPPSLIIKNSKFVQVTFPE